ncbi:uncharacterized protein LOC108906291 [Anoplophora glabripennis]|uniref:uncharacterized protein LOC108906291 n=1 Tax=Anoplophora glabripennis TaxID=217634 RepID=UPI000C77D3C0|nr:uncharacterized protein LOC108906291 [Anoplophora glabripennis]
METYSRAQEHVIKTVLQVPSANLKYSGYTATLSIGIGSGQYENAYRQFKEWCETNKARKASENVLLAYFAERSKKVKPSTLWAVYSMLKSTLNVKENVDIKKFTKLVPYLKKLSVGHNPKKSKVLTREEVNQFIREADDEIYLMAKVVLILGISGACRREELTKMSGDDIEDKGSILIVKDHMVSPLPQKLVVFQPPKPQYPELNLNYLV